MNLRIRKLLPAALGVILCTTITHSSEPAPALLAAPGSEPGLLGLPTQADTLSANQQLANQIQSELNQLGQLKGFRIDIAVNNGVVDLLGFVSSAEDHARVVTATRTVAGVRQIVDRVRIVNQNPVLRTQLLQPPVNPTGPTNAPAPLLQNEQGPAPLLQNPPNNGQGQAPTPLPVFGGQPQEPTPIYKPQPQGPTAQGYGPPKMPPYAWPTYAPYNNYSRVAYPLSYPAQSWPFIGPIHPYPKVPLGWRSVSLTWQDGFWWYGRNSTGYDWWRLRFW